MKILELITGILGVTVSAIIYQQKDRRRLLYWKFISDIVWGLQFYSTGKETAAIMSAVAMFREIVYIIYAKKEKKVGVGWLVVFMTLAASSSAITFDGGFKFVVPAFLSVVAGLASAISALSFWLGSPPKSRIIAFPYSTGMMVYDIFGGTGQVAWFGILNESFTLISSIVGIIRFDLKKKAKKSNEITEETLKNLSDNQQAE